MRKNQNFEYGSQGRSLPGKTCLKQLSLAVFLTVAAVSGLMGCAAVGPDYKPAEIAMDKAWHSETAKGLTRKGNPSDTAQWWDNFNDPVLSELIAKARENNLDLKEAKARIREARAQKGVTRAQGLPAVDGTGAVSRSGGSQEGQGTATNYTAGFDAGWELDVFGGVRRSKEASEASLRMSVEDLGDVMVSLLAETALNYIDARTLQKRLAVAEADLESRQETWNLLRSQYDAGLIAELDVVQARTSLESARSKIPALQTSLDAALNRIAVLLGQRPGELHAMLDSQSPIPVSSTELAVGVPADTLRNRPDIRMAEQEVALRTAQVGVATADLYPKFTLLGAIGLESLSAKDFLTAPTRTWSLGPSFSWKIFDAGAVRQTIEVQSALQEQALIQYQSSILAALEEVENALFAYARELELQKTLTDGMEAAEQALKLAQDQYASGLGDFSDVLEARRSLLTFENDLAQSRGTLASDLVRLYKVLGGGWTHTVPLTEDPLTHHESTKG